MWATARPKREGRKMRERPQPACSVPNLAHLQQAFLRRKVATEQEFSSLFPDCELGAMPPFGSLYNLPVYVDESLAADEAIVFNAGTHRDAIRIRYDDFVRLAKPRVCSFAQKG